MSDQNIKKMAVMLRSGATMLDEYCPKCNNILFRLKDQRIFCPICEAEVKIIKQSKGNIENPNQNVKSATNSTQDLPVEKELNSNNLVELNNVYSQLFSRLTQELNSQKDLYMIEKYLDSLTKVLGIIKLLRDLQK
jgi:uncharacterized Zn finger protein (UPF0148 family)